MHTSACVSHSPHTHWAQREADECCSSPGDIITDLRLFLICRLRCGNRPTAARRERAGGAASEDAPTFARFASAQRVVSCGSVQIKEHSAVLHPGFDLDGYYNSCFLHSLAISWERFSLLKKMWCCVLPGTSASETVCDIKIGYLIKPHQRWIFDCQRRM